MNIDGNRSSKAEKDKSRRFNSNMRERIQSLIQDNGFTIKTFAEKIVLLVHNAEKRAWPIVGGAPK
jgi:hypothetical protein